MPTWKKSLVIYLFCLAAPAMGDSAGDPVADREKQCLLNALETASDDDTVGMLREKCSTAQAPDSEAESVEMLLQRRVAEEGEAVDNRFSLLQHKSNYLLPVSYNTRVNRAPFDADGTGDQLDELEVKFQLSLKVPLFPSLFRASNRLFVGYTNTSWWQAYNSDISGPFRETNHEPELFLDMDTPYRFGNWSLPLTRFGLSHLSNGRSGDLSRSWNRAYAQFVLQKRNWALSFKPWIELPSDSADVDNPDIDHYMGHFELGVLRKGDATTSSILLRNNFKSDNKGAFQYDWSRVLPHGSNLRMYLQYFYGYGESLIDYNAVTNRLSLGFRLSDWL